MRAALNLIRRFAALIAVLTCLNSLVTFNVHAGEWKTCIVGNATVNNRDMAIAFGKIDKRFSFFKQPDDATINIFLDGKSWRIATLKPTGRRFYGDGKPYLGYVDATKTLIVQEFENNNSMIVSLNGDFDFTMFATCD